MNQNIKQLREKFNEGLKEFEKLERQRERKRSYDELLRLDKAIKSYYNLEDDGDE